MDIEIVDEKTIDALKEIPQGIYEANRYDTDDEMVLMLHNKQIGTIDIRLKKQSPQNHTPDKSGGSKIPEGSGNKNRKGMGSWKDIKLGAVNGIFQ